MDAANYSQKSRKKGWEGVYTPSHPFFRGNDSDKIMKRRISFFFILFILVLAALACNAGNNPPALPTSLPAIPTLDPNLSDKFEDEWQKSLAEAIATGNFTVTITEGQLTEFINRKNDENQNSTLSDIQVFLRDGQIQIYSTAANDSGSTTLEIVATVGVSPEGVLQIDVVSAKLGPFPVPDPMLEGISQSINDALNGQGTTGSDKIQIESIVIADGFMTISGKIQ